MIPLSLMRQLLWVHRAEFDHKYGAARVAAAAKTFDGILHAISNPYAALAALAWK